MFRTSLINSCKTALIHHKHACCMLHFFSPCLVIIPLTPRLPFLNTECGETAEHLFSSIVGSHTPAQTSLSATVCWFWITSANIEHFVIHVVSDLSNLSDKEQEAKKREGKLTRVNQPCSGNAVVCLTMVESNCCGLIRFQGAYT